ncbi:MAG: fumarylacetoacetase [Acetobacteraceae bacterium]|nr:fumarylacetoacetase [Acetobacteraceae bacterium]
MAANVDHTHDPLLRSWVEGSDGHAEFPIQNLPFGVFSPLAGAPRGGIAIGDYILDLRTLHDAGLLDDEAQAACHLCTGPTLNAVLALGPGPRATLRDAASALLAEGADERPALLHRAADCLLYMPSHVGDYTDFYAGIHHATNVGRLMRPDNPLPPNYKWVPIGYHGRASSLRVSGAEIRRPNGQRKRADEPEPSFGPSRNLDYELELGAWIGQGNALGTPIPIGEAGGHIAGYCLLNDWSARDIQGWEYQPLGPFLAKSFATSISPWIVTPEALAPFRCAQTPRPEGDPRPLPYLWDDADQAGGALDLDLEVLLLTRAMRERGEAPHQLSRGTARDLYWTPAQLVAHHASGGCNLQAGDLLGTGTISGHEPGTFGSLLELTRGGREPLRLPGGEERRFLEDGDEVILRARARREGYVPIGLGECWGRVVPAAAD